MKDGKKKAPSNLAKLWLPIVRKCALSGVETGNDIDREYIYIYICIYVGCSNNLYVKVAFVTGLPGMLPQTLRKLPDCSFLEPELQPPLQDLELKRVCLLTVPAYGPLMYHVYGYFNFVLHVMAKAPPQG